MLIVTVPPLAKPWFPIVVTCAVVPVRTIDAIRTVVEAPKAAAAMPVLAVENSLLLSVNAALQLLPLGQCV